MSLLSIENLYSGYGTGTRRIDVVKGVSLTIDEDEAVAIVGESGSGKSTLALAILGLAKTHSGRVSLHGRDATDRRDTQFRRSVQMIFQSPAASLNPRMTIGSILREALGLRDRQSVTDRLSRLMAQTGLDLAWTDRLPHELSGGQLQRVVIARALAIEPQLLIADEITSALDPSIQADVLNLLEGVRAERRLALLFITHNLAVARHLTNRTLVMRQGVVVESGLTRDVLTTPTHPYTASLIQAEPALGRRLGATSK
jgi:ABC-type dipeptide/oligopeptide/nickel transport system ATPase subunit